MAEKKETRPKTGRKTDSKMTSLLKRLSADEPTGALPQLPEPTFDREMGALFREKKSK